MASFDQDPLPPGWEWKYDQAQQKYFFIDHSTHTTSWTDPRLTRRQNPTAWASYQRSQQQQQQQQQQRPGNSFEMAPVASQPSAIKCATCHTTTVERTGADCRSCKDKRQAEFAASQRETSFSQPTLSPEMSEKVNKLNSLFPGTEEKTLIDNLNSSSKDLDSTVDKLMDKGYYKCSRSNINVKAMWAALKKDCPTAKSSYLRAIMINFNYDNGMIREQLLNKGYLKDQPVAGTSSSSPSSDDKDSPLKEKLKRMFPGNEKELTLAMTITNNDEARTIKLMKEVFAKDVIEADKGRGSQSASHKSTTATDKKTPAKGNPVKPSTAKSSTTKATPAKVNNSAVSKSSRGPAPRKAAGEGSTYKSELLSVTKGSDRSLSAGPNPERLIKTWTAVAGANRHLVHGPGLAVGPSRSLAHGPSRSTRIGSSPTLAKGPAVRAMCNSEAWAKDPNRFFRKQTVL